MRNFTHKIVDGTTKYSTHGMILMLANVTILFHGGRS